MAILKTRRVEQNMTVTYKKKWEQTSDIQEYTSGISVHANEIRVIFSLSSYEHEVDKWKKSFKYYSSNVRELLEIDTTP